MNRMKKKWVAFSLLTCSCFVALFPLVRIELEKKKSAASGEANVLLVLGAQVRPDGSLSKSLRARLDEALRYSETYPIDRWIVSGGQGSDEPIAEADAMALYLIERGVPNERIVRERESTSTLENMEKSAPFVPSDARLGVVTNDFHLARSHYYAKRVGLSPLMIGAPTPDAIRLQATVREIAALWKAWLVD